MSQADGVILTGLDGSNPLAFLAALGALDAASEQLRTKDRRLRLAWRDEGAWRPVIFGVESLGELIETLTAEQASWRDAPALQLRYGKQKKGQRAGKEAHDLKPPPDQFRAFVEQVVGVAEQNPNMRRQLDMVASYGTDAVTDNQGNMKPTALHFTAGQQEFLAMVDELARLVTPADLEEALIGPWKYERPLPVLQWDSSGARDYALRAEDPSKDKKTGVPGADWLAYRALPLFRVAPVHGRLQTTCCGGGWKDGFFEWPIWSAALTREVVQVLLGVAKLCDLPGEIRRARGVVAVFRSAIRRSDQGGYGRFLPAEAL